MAYSSTGNPPSRISVGLLAQTNNVGSTSMANGGSVWSYCSTNLSTDMQVANFFSDALALGMRNGDIMMAASYSTQGSTSHQMVVGMITGVSSSGANLSTAGSITSS